MPRLRSSIPAVAFAAAVCWIGWTAGHELIYDLLGLAGTMPAESVHGYLPFARGGAALLAVVAFALFVRALFSSGGAKAWLRHGGRLGTRTQLLIATIVPAVTFFVAESAERAYTPVDQVSALELFSVGLPVQMLVGLLTLAIARFSLRAAARAIDSYRSDASQERRAPLSELFHSIWAAPAPKPLIAAPAGRAPPFV